MKETILISGITGFVGVNLKDYLAPFFNIIGLSRNSGEHIGYTDMHKGLFDGAKAFVHLAGKAHDLKKTTEEIEYYRANTELTKTLFDQFLDSDCEVFIYMSSVKAVADDVEGVLKEDIEPNPITVYGKSKLRAEKYLLSQDLPSNKRLYILRPCMIHGPNNKGNLNLLYTFVSKGIPYPFGAYQNKRSFLSVQNLCFVIHELIQNPIESDVFNVADDESLSTIDLVKTIGNVIDKKIIILKAPKFIINVLAIIGSFLPFPINPERVQKLTENYIVSNEKLKRKLGKRSLNLSVQDGIKLTILSIFKEKRK